MMCVLLYDILNEIWVFTLILIDIYHIFHISYLDIWFYSAYCTVCTVPRNFLFKCCVVKNSSLGPVVRPPALPG